MPSVDSRRITRSIQIRRPAIDLYTAWYHLSHRPTVSIAADGPLVSATAKPRIKAPCAHTVGSTVIADFIHGLFISWKSEPATGIAHSGEVWFHTAGSGLDTTVSILLSWDGDVTGAPPQTAPTDIDQLDQDLRGFKSLMER